MTRDTSGFRGASSAPASGGVLAWVLPLSGALFALGAVASVEMALPQFATTFQAFGAELPAATRALLRVHALGWLLPLAAPLVAVMWPHPRQRAWMGLLAGIVAGMGWVTAAVVCLYLPIQQLATTI